MFDSTMLNSASGTTGHVSHTELSLGSTFFRVFKRSFDIMVSIALLPGLLGAILVLLVLNPFLNQGSIFFVQKRMGRGCKSFQAIKFRSMRKVTKITRSADDPLELDRITPLGHFLRKSRLDELPQILNVLMGDMSLIGPRPDFIDHAEEYLQTIPGYRERHMVRPGISGLAQTELGYIEGTTATRRKVQADLYYITHRGFGLEMWIFWRTLSVVARRAGA
ncbi:sugar transferase [Pelagimonas varians]|uniref:UDP-N-acetylgalactosamine-undecaprenyl-phosphate N-acetylgalactosaminephosphotransferase n=1 Tax=Pelagimonas varians TaxID=696760 RepID=A0A238KBK9_9RHOB|nr:sugar transferase [Pelagimonas varians]PYG31073.1 lipopolysaccharide/colanic/teichoic acid biosynthesis glycosyltransferase [Pelagimonas varians]SMX39582.1 UDP-N-acetylgalactosamine-undecaprenyl-phosphate N-acetylgalactosaminephosphotransferase [Pelagimonas varians]